MNFLSQVGAWAIASWLGCGRAFLLLFDIVLAIPRLLKRFGQIVRQLHAIGVMSLPIIAVSGVFVGMVLAFQGYTTLTQFGAESALGTMVSLSLLRELGPVVTALLFAKVPWELWFHYPFCENLDQWLRHYYLQGVRVLR